MCLKIGSVMPFPSEWMHRLSSDLIKDLRSAGAGAMIVLSYLVRTKVSLFVEVFSPELLSGSWFGSGRRERLWFSCICVCARRLS